MKGFSVEFGRKTELEDIARSLVEVMCVEVPMRLKSTSCYTPHRYKNAERVVRGNARETNPTSTSVVEFDSVGNLTPPERNNGINPAEVRVFTGRFHGVACEGRHRNVAFRDQEHVRPVLRTPVPANRSRCRKLKSAVACFHRRWCFHGRCFHNAARGARYVCQECSRGHQRAAVHRKPLTLACSQSTWAGVVRTRSVAGLVVVEGREGGNSAPRYPRARRRSCRAA